MTEYFIIVLDQGSPEERAAIHALVKEHASGWWHHFGDVWLAGGKKKASEWRDLLKEATTGSGSALMVMKLPKSGRRSWAYFGPKAKERCDWVHRNYNNQ